MPESPPGMLPSASSAPTGEGRGRRYRVLGFTLETDLELQTPLLPSDDEPDLRLHLTQGSDLPDWPTLGPAVFESPILIEDGVPLVTLHRASEGDLLRFSEVADFFLSDAEIRVHLLDPEYTYMVEVHLLGVVLSYWLERQGIPILHASAVSVANGTVGFIGTNRGGKSSLAVSLMERRYPLVSDDLVGLQRTEAGVEARPGFPSMRMWPDLARHVLGEAWERMPLAHPRYDKRRIPVGPDGFGHFLDRVQPLACLYLPERKEAKDGTLETRIQSLSPREALFELLRGSFLTRLPQAAGLASRRLQLLSAVVETVPVRRLIYPSGFQHLPEVSRRILEDLDDLDRRHGEGPG
jgi:hypothetical protein